MLLKGGFETYVWIQTSVIHCSRSLFKIIWVGVGITPLHIDYIIIRFERYAEDYEMLVYALGRNATLVHDNGSNNKYNLTHDEQVAELLKVPYRDKEDGRGSRGILSIGFGYI
mmetsp:Transcript_3258/g.6104  ORF Transcript_3258/g.6104 Transcript_3258/m.6104 type:complete len:113 (+) Transcript_3258:924-1262(+)